MIISYLLALGLIATSSNPTSINYQYQKDISSFGNLPTIATPSDSESNEYIESTYNFTCTLRYNDNQNYEITNCAFQLDATLYYLSNNNRERDTSVRVTKVFTNFDLTYNSPNYLELVSFKIGLDAIEDELYAQIYYDNNIVAENRSESDSSYGNKPSSYMTITLNTSDFYNQIQEFIYSNTNNYNDGYQAGYQSGYTEGYTIGAEQDETATAIFVGIINIALVPINFFLACLNFEVFGINIGGFVSALLTVAIIVIIVRIIVSGGNKNGQ